MGRKAGIGASLLGQSKAVCTFQKFAAAGAESRVALASLTRRKNAGEGAAYNNMQSQDKTEARESNVEDGGPQ